MANLFKKEGWSSPEDKISEPCCAGLESSCPACLVKKGKRRELGFERGAYHKASI